MHPLLFPLGSPKRWTSYLKAELKWDNSQIAYAEELLSTQRIPLWSGFELATYLGLTDKLVRFIRLRPDKFYNSFSIPKKNGTSRTIQAPRLYLKAIQHYILDCILSTATISDCCYGFIRGKSPADGAIRHKGCRYLWNLDLQDFFPSILRDSVRKAFLNLGYTKDASDFLSAICCLNERLPQGAPTSPMLSNIVFKHVDDLLSASAKAHSINYSRYADDLSFSAEIPIPETFQNFVKEIIELEGFKLNPKKERLMGPMCRREVTGLVVNEIISIPRSKRRIFRARFHRVALDPSQFSAERSELAGIAGWVSQHHSKLGEDYRRIVETIPLPQTTA